MKRIEEECTRELQLKEQKRKELYAKQGRGSQFTSKVKRKKIILYFMYLFNNWTYLIFFNVSRQSKTGLLVTG